MPYWNERRPTSANAAHGFCELPPVRLVTGTNASAGLTGTLSLKWRRLAL